MSQTGWSPDDIAKRIAADLPEGAYVNLGIGRPENVANHIPTDKTVVFHTENGLLGMGPSPAAEDVDWELINAGKKPVTIVRGGAFFHHADSFAMIRGRHIDVCVMGGYQVAENGDLANWSTGTPGVPPGVGGAMDLAACAKKIFILMTHATKSGEPKLVREITYPATARGCVSRIYTDLAVVDVTQKGFVLNDLAPGVDFDQVAKLTGAPLLRD